MFYSCMLSCPPTKVYTSSMCLMNREIQCVTNNSRDMPRQRIIIVNYFIDHIFLIILVHADSGHNIGYCELFGLPFIPLPFPWIPI